MAKLRDKYWIWGHPENCFLGHYNHEIECRMTPMEGALYMGARNMFMVPNANKTVVNVRQYNYSFTTLDHVGWLINQHPEVHDPIIAEAKDFPNVDCMVFDDFFRIKNTQDPVTVEEMFAMREKLHNNPIRPMDMWMVLYTHEFDDPKCPDDTVDPYIAAFDGIIMWNWWESRIGEFEKKDAWFRAHTEGKKRMLGLYVYNFGEKKQAEPDVVLWQLNRYYELLKAGEIDGIVLHTNAMGDCDYPAFKVVHDWMLEHGDEEIAD